MKKLYVINVNFKFLIGFTLHFLILIIFWHYFQSIFVHTFKYKKPIEMVELLIILVYFLQPTTYISAYPKKKLGMDPRGQHPPVGGHLSGQNPPPWERARNPDEGVQVVSSDRFSIASFPAPTCDGRRAGEALRARPHW